MKKLPPIIVQCGKHFWRVSTAEDALRPGNYFATIAYRKMGKAWCPPQEAPGTTLAETMAEVGEQIELVGNID